MKNSKPLKEKVSITLDSDVIEALKERSELDDRPFSQYINRVLRRYLISKGYFQDKTQKSNCDDKDLD